MQGICGSTGAAQQARRRLHRADVGDLQRLLRGVAPPLLPGARRRQPRLLRVEPFLAPLPLGCESAARVASFPLIDAWRGSPDGDGKTSGNYFERGASFWSGWGDGDDAGLLIAPDGAEGTSSVEYATLGKWALLPQHD